MSNHCTSGNVTNLAKTCDNSELKQAVNKYFNS